MNGKFRGAAGITAGAVALGLVLSGCSSQASQDPDAPVTITWWAWDSMPVAQSFIDGFMAENPGITVENKTYSAADYQNVIRPALTSNTGPDVFQIAPGGMLENYGPLAEDLGPYATDAWGPDWTSGYNASAVDQLNLDGVQVALPNYMSAAGLLYYNETLTTQLGIDVPTSVPAWIETCKTVKAAGYTCLAQGAKDAWASTDVFMALANSAEPGEVYDAIAGKKSWTSDGLVEAMTAWRSLFTEGVIDPGATAQGQYPDAFNAFLENKAVFLAMGTWNTPGTMTKAGVAVSQASVSSPIDGIFLSAPFPATVAGGEPTKLFGGVANGWAISSKSQHKDAAAKFVEYLAGADGQQLIGDATSFPALKSATVNTSDVIAQSQVADVDRQKSDLGDIVGYRDIPYPDLGTAIGVALSNVASGQQTPEAALEAIQSVSDGLSR